VEPLDLDLYRTGKAYSVADAAWLGGVSASTARRWIEGYDSRWHNMDPVFGPDTAAHDTDRLLVSFLELMEFIVVVRFRRGMHGAPPVPLERIRRAHQYAREHFGIPYPFASLKLWQQGPDIFHTYEEERADPGVLVLSRNGQLVLPDLVQREERHIVFGDDSFALRWYPLGEDEPIVIDPRIAAGRPTIAGTGVTLDTIRARISAGDPIDFIAEDYEIAQSSIEVAVGFAA
jgi:uncharacterized protein (DUF433 family)